MATVTIEQTIEHWEHELARAYRALEDAKKYDDRGAVEWEQEQVRWARMKLEQLYREEFE